MNRPTNDQLGDTLAARAGAFYDILEARGRAVVQRLDAHAFGQVVNQIVLDFCKAHPEYADVAGVLAVVLASRPEPTPKPPARTKPLTKPQRRELEKLASGPQATYGPDRVRVQNTLVRWGLAEYVGENADAIPFSEGSLADDCRITDAGRAVLKEGK